MRFHLLAAPALLLSVAATAPAQTPRVYSAPSAGVLRMGEDQPRAALGISTAGSTSVRDTLGVLVAAVVPNSPAERAGIQEGDRIASINGVTLRTSPADAGDFDVSNAMARRLTRELNKLRPGDDVDLRVYAEGRTRTVHLRTGDSDSLYARRRVARNNGDDERPTLGLGIGSTSSRRDTLGVLVMFVDDSGPAARAGIEEGNRIAAIDEVDLRVSRDESGDEFLGTSRVRRLQREVAKLHPGDNVDLRVYANGEFHTVRLRVARAADMPRRHSFTITGDGMGGMGLMGPGMLPFNIDGALIGEQVRTAIERAMEASGRALEGVGRGLNRNRSTWQDDDDDRPKHVMPREPREPMEPLRIEPLEPSRLRMLPRKVPYTSVLLDDSSRDAPMANAILRDPSSEGARGATLDIAGLRMVPVGSELATYLGKGSERGLLVIEVPEWAHSALREGDVVLSVDGAPVRTNEGNDLQFALPRYGEAQLDILRDRVHHSVMLPARR